MPLFAVTYIDKPEGAPIRAAVEKEHQAYFRNSGVVMRLAGPFLDEQDQVRGALLVLEFEDLAAAQAFSDDDPFTKAGLWASVDIRRFKSLFADL